MAVYDESIDDGGESNQGIADAYDQGRIQPQPAPAAQQTDWTAIALGQPTWNQADQIDLERLTNGASYLRNRAMSGEHGPETTQALTAQLNEQLGPLMQRKQAAEKMQQQSATEQALHANAMAGGIRAADMTNNAQAFPGQVHERFNPNTGGIDLFFQHKPGEWSIHPGEMPDKPESEADGPMGGAEGGADGTPQEPDSQSPQVQLAPDGKPYGETPRYREFTGPDGILRHQRIPSAAEFDAMQNATPDEQLGIAAQISGGTFGQPKGDGGAMDITNGPFHERVQGGNVLATNRPAPPTADATGGTFHKQAAAEIGPAPPAFYRGAHGQVLPNPQYGRWQAEVSRRAADLGKEHRQTQAEEARAKRDEQKSKADLTEKQRADLYGKEVDRIKKEIHDHRLHTKKPADVPDELKGPTGQYLTPSEQHELARNNVEEMMRNVKGKGATADGGGKAATPQAQSAPAGPAPGPALVEQQHGKLNVLEQHLAAVPEGPNREAAIAAVGQLRPLIAQYGGDLTKAPAEVQAQARQLGETIKKARPGPTKQQRANQYIEQARQGFGM